MQPATEENGDTLERLLGNVETISAGKLSNLLQHFSCSTSSSYAILALTDEWRHDKASSFDQLLVCVGTISLQASALRTAAMWTIMLKGLDGCDGKDLALYLAFFSIL